MLVDCLGLNRVGNLLPLIVFIDECSMWGVVICWEIVMASIV